MHIDDYIRIFAALDTRSFLENPEDLRQFLILVYSGKYQVPSTKDFADFFEALELSNADVTNLLGE
jgi:hypothetical protein